MDVEYTDELGDWFEQLDEEDQEAVVARVELLEARGASLGRPAVDNVHRSRHPKMKELRAERSLRVLFVFDPRRTAILLLAGTRATATRTPRPGTTGTTKSSRSPTICTTTTSTSSEPKD